MLISLWSAKGGSGTTVVAASLALILARSHAEGALLVDLAGDIPAVLGVRDPGDPGLSGWLAAGSGVPADALGHLEVPVGGGCSLLARGTGNLNDTDRAELLSGLLVDDERPVVVDCGVVTSSAVADVLVGAATHSLLVTRPCYLSLRRLLMTPTRPSGVVLVSEQSRRLSRSDVEEFVGAPVWAEVAVDPSVAAAVDSGILASRVPRSLERALRHVA